MGVLKTFKLQTKNTRSDRRWIWMYVPRVLDVFTCNRCRVRTSFQHKNVTYIKRLLDVSDMFTTSHWYIFVMSHLRCIFCSHIRSLFGDCMSCNSRRNAKYLLAISETKISSWYLYNQSIHANKPRIICFKLIWTYHRLLWWASC